MAVSDLIDSLMHFSSSMAIFNNVDLYKHCCYYCLCFKLLMLVFDSGCGHRIWLDPLLIPWHVHLSTWAPTFLSSSVVCSEMVLSLRDAEIWGDDTNQISKVCNFLHLFSIDCNRHSRVYVTHVNDFGLLSTNSESSTWFSRTIVRSRRAVLGQELR